jgi:hypothetical protein
MPNGMLLSGKREHHFQGAGVILIWVARSFICNKDFLSISRSFGSRFAILSFSSAEHPAGRVARVFATSALALVSTSARSTEVSTHS